MKKYQQTTRAERRKHAEKMLLESPEMTNRAIGSAVGISHTTVIRYRKNLIERGLLDQKKHIAEGWHTHPYIQKNPRILHGLNERDLREIKRIDVLDIMLERNLKSPIYAARLLAKMKKSERKGKTARVSESDFQAFSADVATHDFGEVDDGSVALLFCDAEYKLTTDNIKMYSGIAQTAGRVLSVDGGVLAVMSGTLHIPPFLTALSSCHELKYITTIAVVNNRRSPKYQYINVSTHWRPIYIFVRGHHRHGLFSNLMELPPDTQGMDRLHHPHGTSAWLTSRIIEMFSESGDLIADFAVGAGTTAIEALKLGRRVVCSDIDPGRVELTMRRVREWFDGQQKDTDTRLD
jgi:predicted transcriptional regulator